MDAREILEQGTPPDIDLQDIIVTDGARNRLLELGYTNVEFSTEGGSFNISFGVGARAHPAYGFAPTVIDSSWYTSAWWDFAEDEFGVDDKSCLLYTSPSPRDRG